MLLNTLLKRNDLPNININGIKTNSKEVKDGDLFVCIKGANIDRHNFINDAISNGAKAIIVSKDVECKVPSIKVDDPDKELFSLLDTFYDHPQNKLKLIGITGTDGKTTVAKIIQQLIGDVKCGYIGTIGYDCAYFKGKTNNTTPPIEKLFEIFDSFVKHNIEYVSIEASSEAFFYHRLDNLHFYLGLHTNITSEHLNTHKTLENYIECKKQLFKNSTYQILNTNCVHYEEVKNVSCNFSTYGYNNASILIKDIDLYPNKTIFKIQIDNNEYSVNSSLLGKFNVENLTLAITCMIKLGYDITDILNKTNSLVIPGRMQVINNDQEFNIVVDYAHTANAVKNVLDFARQLDVNRIITIIGQAGGRDPYKRKEVGKYVLEYSDLAILTEDDPRYEKVEDIIQMMLEDTKKDNYIIVLKRNEAIKKAISMAKANDLLLFLGKGTDNYMAIEDRRDYYSEIEEIANALKG